MFENNLFLCWPYDATKSTVAKRAQRKGFLLILVFAEKIVRGILGTKVGKKKFYGLNKGGKIAQ